MVLTTHRQPRAISEKTRKFVGEKRHQRRLHENVAGAVGETAGVFLIFISPVLWHLPLNSPVVDLFSVQPLPHPPSPPPGSNPPQKDGGESRGVEAQNKFFLVPSERATVGVGGLVEAHRLRRVVFSTYALDLNESYASSAAEDAALKAALWEEKLCRKNKFV